MMKAFVDLSRFVNPRNIAVVGASGRDGSQGRRLFDNLVLHSAPQGTVYPVNPAYEAIGALQCWPSLRKLPECQIDVALIIVNASQVLESLRQCVERGIPFAIVMTSGFAEAGEEGQALERSIEELCSRTGLHVYGPNCPGFVNLRDRLGMTFSPAYKDDLNSGGIGLATQGGGLGRNLLQGLSFGQGVGLWFSAGNEVDLEIPDFIAYMANDPQTRVIALLMEGVKDGRRLTAALELARQRNKPVVVLKIGRSEAGVRAAQSHTASVAGSAAVNAAIFRQFGAIEVDDLDELLSVAQLLARPAPRPGSGLCVFTFSGGTAALAADIAGASGLPFASFSQATTAALKALLPTFANIANPVDTTADILRSPDLTSKCLRIVCDDPDVGVVLFPIPMDYGEVTDAMARTIVDVAAAAAVGGTLVVPVWMSRRMSGGFQTLEKAGLLPFLSLTSAISALSKSLAWRAEPALGATKPVSAEKVTSPTRRMVNEAAAKAMLREAGFLIPDGLIARSEQEAALHATHIGFPVVMKVISEQVPHKTEAGGVQLNLGSAQAVAAAFNSIRNAVEQHAPDAVIEGMLVETMLPAGGREVLIGVHRDDAFGLVLTFGLGGIFVETIRDVVHRMIPVSREQVRAMVREIGYFGILEGVRGQPPADLHALEELIFHTSEFAWSHRATLGELELNPVWVGTIGQGALPLDALIAFDSEPAK